MADVHPGATLLALRTCGRRGLCKDAHPPCAVSQQALHAASLGMYQLLWDCKNWACLSRTRWYRRRRRCSWQRPDLQLAHPHPRLAICHLRMHAPHHQFAALCLQTCLYGAHELLHRSPDAGDVAHSCAAARSSQLQAPSGAHASMSCSCFSWVRPSLRLDLCERIHSIGLG